MLRGAFFLGAALFALPGSAFGQVAEEPSQSSDYWFWAEWQSGAGWPAGLPEDTIGMTNRLAFGVGGKVFGSPVRLFAFLTAGLWQVETHADHALGPVKVDRAFIDGGVGVRLLVPVFDAVRLYVDTQVGYGTLVGDVEVGPLERYDVEVGAFSIGVGGGAQWRMLPWLSLGPRFDWVVLLQDSDLDFAGAVAGLGRASSRSWGRYGLSLTTTFHF